MRSLANTRISIENPKELDEYGDPVDGSDTSLGGPYSASLIERNKVSTDPNDFSKVAFVRYANLRVKSTVPVEQDNVILDLKTSIRWQVVSITQNTSPMGPMDKLCQLRRLSS